MTDDERKRLAQEIAIIGKRYVGGEASKLAAQAAAQLRADGERIRALEKLEEAADLLRIVIEKSKGVWRCDFAEDANGEWDGEHCPWSDFECVTHFLQALNAARERQGEG